MDNSHQDVNQQGQNQPAEDTSSQQTGENNDLQKDEPSNKLKELERKMEKVEIEKDFFQNQVAKMNQQLDDSRLNQQPKKEEPSISDDELWNLISTGDGEQVKLAREEIEKRMQERITNNVIPQVETRTNRQMWENKAIEEFPELGDKTSPFFKKVQDEYKMLNPQLPNIVYLAAKNAADKLNVQSKRQTPSRFDNLNQHTPVNGQSNTNQSGDNQKGEGVKLSEKSKYMTKMFNPTENYDEYEKKVSDRLKDIKRQKKQFRGGDNK